MWIAVVYGSIVESIPSDSISSRVSSRNRMPNEAAMVCPSSIRRSSMPSCWLSVMSLLYVSESIFSVSISVNILCALVYSSEFMG